jgi:iron complex transport system substrate-binding protein
MSRPVVLFMLAVFFLPASLLFGCNDSDGDSPPTAARPSPGASFPMTLQSSDGSSITLNAAPQRIVSLAPSATEILCRIGAVDQLVAVDRFENCPAKSSAKPALDSFMPDIEAIASHRPDLVFTAYNPPGFVDALKRIQVPVLYLDEATNLAGVYESIAMFGSITGKTEQADTLVRSMREKQDAIVKQLPSGTGPKVFHELDPMFFSVGPNGFVGDLYNVLRATNIVLPSDGDYPQLSAEQIIQRNPEVIVLADDDLSITPASVRQRPGWSVIDAVKKDRVCRVDPDVVSRPGPRIVDGLEALAKCLYPAQF